MKKFLKFGLILLGILTFAASCQYKAIIEPVVPPPDPNDTVYFSQQIEPIWTEQNCTGCHPSVSNPDLTTGNAYNSITSMGLVIANDPDGSKIYYYPSPVGNHAKQNEYTSSQAALLLLWIEQGALDN